MQVIQRYVCLKFYGPVNTIILRSCWAGHLTYSNCFGAGLDLPSGKAVLNAHNFARHWQLPFLNQQKGFIS